MHVTRSCEALSAGGPEQLRERLRPFLGAIRRDLRGRPTVFLPGGLVVVETPSRATAGAHYTPKSLATEVVQHALEPLVYDPGPHQQADGWVPVDSDRILELKVADIACGSGAFLVAAARYLAGRLVEAWDREEAVTGLTPAELKTHAIRTVIATCLYGADINAMAVEMCKLSLWLVSLDPKLPFSFVDDKILHGNSLLGLTDVRQLKRQHIDPDAASTQQSLFEVDVDDVLRQATRLRRQLASEVNNADPQRSVNTKRRQWQRFQGYGTSHRGGWHSRCPPRRRTRSPRWRSVTTASHWPPVPSTAARSCGTSPRGRSLPSSPPPGLTARSTRSRSALTASCLRRAPVLTGSS